MYSYFEEVFKYLFIKKYFQNTYTAYITNENINVTKEYRKILDKIAKGLVCNAFDNERLINEIMNLASVERIIIVFSAVLEIDIVEIAYLLDTSIESVCVQKGTALHKLKNRLDK